MSLTGLLKIGRGPVWEWFAEHFPQTQRVSTHANRELRPGRTDAPCVVPSVPGADRGLVGTTVGYVLSAHLRPDGIDVTVATRAARLLDGALRSAPARPSVIERLTVGRIGELRPWTRELPEDEWIELARLAGILARFEQFYRAGPVVWPYLAGPLREFHGDLNDLAIALVDEPTLMDVCTLSRCAVEDHLGIRDAAELHIGPEFAQTGPLGGADADLIYDGTLLDLKSTSAPRALGRIELWQLLGYLLADTGDAYSVRRVGFGALRRRRSIFWPSQELIDLLAGRPAPPVEHWRGEFAGLLAARASKPATVVVRGRAERLVTPRTNSKKVLQIGRFRGRLDRLWRHQSGPARWHPDGSTDTRE
jgi:hypothetical protein